MLRQMDLLLAQCWPVEEQAYADRCRELIPIVESVVPGPDPETATSQDICDYFVRNNAQFRRSIDAKRGTEQGNCRKITGVDYTNSSSKDAAALNGKLASNGEVTIAPPARC